MEWVYSYLTHDDDEEAKLEFPIAYWLLDMHGFFGLFRCFIYLAYR